MTQDSSTLSVSLRRAEPHTGTLGLEFTGNTCEAKRRSSVVSQEELAMSFYRIINNRTDQRLSAPAKQPPKETSGAPPPLTAPLFEYWFFSQAYRRELSRIEKELGVRINTEVLVSVTAVDQTRQDSVNTATQRVTDLYQDRMKNVRCATVPLTHLESETPRLVRNIQTARDKMMNVSADQCLLIGPEPKLAELERQMILGPDVELQRSLTISTSSNVGASGDLRGAARCSTVKEDDCPICMDKLTDRRKLNCGHEFCRACLNESVKSLGEICPVCKDIYGRLVGNQPEGTMNVGNRETSLPGYPHCGTIKIVYNVPEGVQTTDQRLSAPDKQPPKEASGAPPPLTAPLFECWYFSRAYRRELSRIEKELGVRINTEVLVSVTAVDQSRQDSVNTATQRVTDLYQDRMKNLRCATVPLTHLESEITWLVRNIQMARDKMMMNVSESQCLLIGPEPKLAELDEQMTLGPDVELQRSLTISTSSNVGASGDLRGAAGSTKEEEEDNEDDCPICMDKLTASVKLKCGHEFCRACVNAVVKTLGEICPLCRKFFGKLVGNQPEGSMSVYKQSYSLPGYPRCGTIEIVYDVPDGTQTKRHPNPGKPFFGTTRLAYLPDDDEGREVLNLLRRAFKQRLIFSVGTSSTTGLQNTVIWNDIPHKTKRTGGPQRFGYPDLDYLRRVREKLKAKGIETKRLSPDPPHIQQQQQPPQPALLL